MDHEMMRRLHGGKVRGPTIAYHIALKAMRKIAAETWQFEFRKPEGFQYNAGQHVRMTLPSVSANASGGNTRFLSFASSPHEADLVFAVRMRETAFKRELMSLKSGDEVVVEMLAKMPPAAFGSDIDSADPRLFVAGGIGIVPAYSMIKAILHKTPDCDLILITLNRTPNDAPYLEELRSMSGTQSGLSFVPVMTQATEWTGETGRLSRRQLDRLVPRLKERRVYVTGLEGMVRATVQMLRRAGVRRSHIASEQFGAFSMGKNMHKEHSGRSGLLSAIVLAIIGLHLAGGVYAFRTALTSLSLDLSLLSGIGLAAAAIILLKFLAFRWFAARHR